MSHHSMIAEVEEALRQLMDPATPAQNKAQLEAQLAQFKAQVSTCLPVLFQLLSASSNEYALWFASTTLEEYVATRWRQFAAPQRHHIRQFVWDYVLARSSSDANGLANGNAANPPPQQAAFVLRKLRKVVADIARLEWTTSANATPSADSAGSLWPDFMSQIEALIMDASTRVCGLEMLRVVAEEFGRDDALALAALKKRAKNQLSVQLPSLLTLLTNVLQASSHHVRTENDHRVAHDRVAQIALETLSHLIVWAPVAEAMNDAWIPLLFEISENWQHVHRRGISAHAHLAGSSLMALQCLAELMTKRFGPGRMDEIVAQCMMGLCPLLQKTVEDDLMGIVTEEYLDKLTEYVEAFLTQHLKRLEHPQYESVLPTFLQLVMTLTQRQPHVNGFLNCMSVWEVFVGYIEEAEQNEAASNERMRQLLSAYENGLVGVMFHLVERVNYATNENQLVDLGDEEDEGSSAFGKDVGDEAAFDIEGDTGEGRYLTGSLQDLAQWWANRGNSGDAPSMASANIELSDYREFVVECIALIRRIAAFPACGPALLEKIAGRVKETCESLVFRMHETPSLPPGSDAWTQERYAIRDLSVNCAILSSVCAQHNCVSQEMSDQMTGWQILHMFISLAEYITRQRLHTRGDVFVELHCEVLTCIRFCLTCIPFVIQNGARDDVFKATENVLQILLQTLDTTIVPSPQLVMQNAMQLLASLGYVLPYDDLINLPSMSQLEANIHQFSQHLPLTIQGDLYTSMSNSILNSAISMRNSGATNDEAMQRWANAYGALILPIRESIEQSALTVQQNEHRVLESVMVTQLQRDFYLVRCLARSVETKPKIAKDGFCSAYQPTFPSFLALLTTYFTTIKKTALSSSGSSPRAQSQVKNALKVVNEIIRLYAQLLKSIRKEMQKDTVAEIMRIFVEIFSDSQLSAILNNQGTPGVMVLCGFLQLLKIVVEEPTSLFSSFIQNILDLCYGPLKESIFRHRLSEAHILGYFVALVEQLLEKHFRFFVSLTITPDRQRERAFSSDIAHTYFVSIFQSLAAILTRDGIGATAPGAEPESLSPRLCRQVLALLDRIDKTQSLFAFTGFQSEIRLGFLSTLMNILTKGEMNLLQEEIIGLIHRLAGVDFQSFYQVFLPTYTKDMLSPKELEVAGSFGEGQCLQWSGQVDLPTFTTDVHGFLNDLRLLKAQA